MVNNRITSLFLLLRALCSKLNSMTETKEVKNFKGQIESALWEQDELTAEVDFEKTLIESRVMRDAGTRDFRQNSYQWHYFKKVQKITIR